tara:strand:- start:71 stop:442 length:372 start_codon:yes stop_codon:yes gene_type:complete
MKVYQQVAGYEESITNLNISIDDTFSGFSVAAGTGNAEGDGLLNSGFVFSGSVGYIFDQSGRFVGGYSPNIPFDISVHMKRNDTYSYFIDDVLIANNITGSTGFDYIEFEKHGDSSLGIEYIF